MAAIGGSVEEVSIKGRIFAVASDADATKKLGGFENEVAANGNGTARILKTRMPWSIEGLVVEIDDTAGDHEFLQAVANENAFVPVSMTLASGVTYSADGMLTGDLSGSSQSATCGINLSGPGSLGAQS